MAKKFRDFKLAREFVRNLKLNTLNKWREYCKSGSKPDDIPTSPWNAYQNKGWINLGDWLGTENVASKDKKFRSFHDAREYVRKLNLKNRNDWRKYSKSGSKPKDIPTNPDSIYKNNGWRNIGDWLGTENVARGYRKWRSFENVQKFVKSKNIKSQNEWIAFCKSGSKPNDIPVKPQITYKKNWISWGDFLGTGRVADQFKKYRSFKEAREFVRSLGIKGQKEWQEYCKSGNKPDDIPVAANITYKKDWKGMGDWLGTDRIQTQQRQYRTFSEAKKFIQSLGIKSMKEWQEYCTSGNKPEDIPSAPWVVYSKKRSKFDK